MTRMIFATTLAVAATLSGSPVADAGHRCCCCYGAAAPGGRESGDRYESGNRFAPVNDSRNTGTSSPTGTAPTTTANGTGSTVSNTGPAATFDSARVASELEFLRLEERVSAIEQKLKIQRPAMRPGARVVSEVLGLAGLSGTGRLVHLGDAALDRLLARLLHESALRDVEAGGGPDAGSPSSPADPLRQEQILLQLENDALQELIGRRAALNEALTAIDAEIPERVNRHSEARAEVAKTIDEQRADARAKYNARRNELLQQLPDEIKAKLK